MSKCSKIEPIVKQILIDEPSTRDDDFLLIYKVYKELLPNLDNMNFRYIMSNHVEYNLPCFESITRARRKLQNQYKELSSSKKVQKLRESLEEDYIEYAVA